MLLPLLVAMFLVFSGQGKREEQAMKCLECHQDVKDNEGRRYLYYYGFQTGSYFRGRRGAIYYQIDGKDQEFLCNSCVDAYATSQFVMFCRTTAAYIVLLALLSLLPVGMLLFMGANLFPVYGLVLPCALLIFLGGEWLNRRSKQQHFIHVSGRIQARYGSELLIPLKVKVDMRSFMIRELKIDETQVDQVKVTEKISWQFIQYKLDQKKYSYFTPRQIKSFRRVSRVTMNSEK